MVRAKDSYLFNVHYPVGEDAISKIRKRAGDAYTDFVKDYILALPISEEDKNKLYIRVIEHLLNNYDRV